MELLSEKRILAILRILEDATEPLGSLRVATALHDFGIDVQERMVRYVLRQTDRQGLTRNLGRRGHAITPAGRERVRTAGAFERVGFISARVDELAYKMSFDPATRKGTIILNHSTLRAAHFPRACRWLEKVLAADLGMGRYVSVVPCPGPPGGPRLPTDRVCIGTVCSVTLNGVLRLAGIPVHSRFGGLLEVREGRPVRFTQIIHYDGTTIDPIEIFLKGRMTRVGRAAETGSGIIGASFRELPAAALDRAAALIARLERIGLGGVQVVGRPGRPLLGVPVAQGRVGLVVAAGLNPVAAMEEDGIETENRAMAVLADRADLMPVADLRRVRLPAAQLRQRLSGELDRAAPSRESGLYE